MTSATLVRDCNFVFRGTRIPRATQPFRQSPREKSLRLYCPILVPGTDYRAHETRTRGTRRSNGMEITRISITRTRRVCARHGSSAAIKPTEAEDRLREKKEFRKERRKPISLSSRVFFSPPRFFHFPLTAKSSSACTCACVGSRAYVCARVRVGTCAKTEYRRTVATETKGWRARLHVTLAAHYRPSAAESVHCAGPPARPKTDFEYALVSVVRHREKHRDEHL
jgi:hypothetical protein